MKKILVVDDDEDILHIVKYLLTSQGFDVQTHSTGLNVPEVVRSYDPNLILLDILLPEKSGIEICKELKQMYAIPIILISAYSDYKKSFVESRSDAFVVKPFDTDQLVNTIKSHLK